jgi:N-acetylglucosaminyldiphosphoundecaprenol N-acetyl-beta-D-mannosaminyltransferase
MTPPASSGSDLCILGLRVDNVTLPAAVATIVERARAGTPTRVGFVNAHCVNVAMEDPAYRDDLDAFDLVFADGSGVRLAGRILGTPVRDNVNGTDLFPPLCHALADAGLPVYFMGAAPGVVEQMVQRLAETEPGLCVAGCHHGYVDDAELPAVLADIRGSGARVLLVAMGVPQQEKWIARHHAACGVPVVLAVGGLFDFYSGRIPRAPQWLRRRGLEWTWRLAQEPRRMWRRYLIGNWTFLGRVAVARLAGRGAGTRGRP